MPKLMNMIYKNKSKRKKVKYDRKRYYKIRDVVDSKYTKGRKLYKTLWLG